MIQPEWQYGEQSAEQHRLTEWTEARKQLKKTLLDIFERYLEGYITLFDAIWSV